MVGFTIQNICTWCKQYRCPICDLLLRDPVQLLCGHRYCESCVEDQHRIYIQCHQCKELTLRSKMFYDRGIKTDMEILNTICSFCPWNGLFKNYQDHLNKNHSNDQRNGNDVLFQMQQLNKKINECRNKVEILKEIVQEILSGMPLYKMSVEEQHSPEEILPQNQNCIVSYDGALLLKIDNVQSKLNDNRSVVTSPSFYTSPNGYKMCVRLHLNGNGIGQSTHISICLILMRGDYDSILEWPFNYQVIFCLYDMCNKKNHIIKSISFQQSQSEMNIGSGIPDFIPLSIIQPNNNPYICDGSLYIKVLVRKDLIPPSVLPNVMCIDPALPVYMQEEIIQKEIERHKMQQCKLTLTLKLSQLL